MSVSEPVAPESDARPPLSFQRTVDRSLVHRESIAEVFVADSVRLGDRRCLIGAQLPLTHGYYSDHLSVPARYDPMLLLEACRQAGIYGAHAVVGLALGHSMIVSTFSLELGDVDATITGAEPGELVLDTTLSGDPTPRGRVRNAGVEQELYLGGRLAGRHELSLKVMRGSEITALRDFQRGTTAPSTSDYHGFLGGEQVAPHLVGRVDPRNVVLADLRRSGDAVTARVSPYFGNRALFDHEYDHLPAMVLTEAARQAALALVDDGTGTELLRYCVAGVTAVFERYAELDESLLVHATSATRDAGRKVTVKFGQGGENVAEIGVRLVRTEGE